MSEKIKIAFFDAKDYDKESFDRANESGEYEITYFETKLSEDTIFSKAKARYRTILPSKKQKINSDFDKMFKKMLSNEE